MAYQQLGINPVRIVDGVDKAYADVVSGNLGQLTADIYGGLGGGGTASSANINLLLGDFFGSSGSWLTTLENLFGGTTVTSGDQVLQSSIAGLESIWNNIFGTPNPTNSNNILQTAIQDLDAIWNTIFGTTTPTSSNNILQSAIQDLDAIWNTIFGTTTPTSSNNILQSAVQNLETDLSNAWTALFGSSSTPGTSAQVLQSSIQNLETDLSNAWTALFGSSTTPASTAQVQQTSINGLTTLWNQLFGTTTPTGSSKVQQVSINGLTTLWNQLFGTTTPTGSSLVQPTSVANVLGGSSLAADLSSVNSTAGTASTTASATNTNLTNTWSWLFGTTTPTSASTINQDVVTGLTDVWDWLTGSSTPPTSSSTTQVQPNAVPAVGNQANLLDAVQAGWDALVQAFTGSTDTGHSLGGLANAASSTATTASGALMAAQSATMVQAQQTAAKAFNAAIGDTTADTTFDASHTWTLSAMPTISVTSATNIVGYITTADNVSKLSLMFVAETIGTVTAVHINVFLMPAATQVVTSGNIVSEIGTLEGVVYFNFASPLPVAPGQLYGVQILITGSGSLKMMGLSPTWVPTNSAVASSAGSAIPWFGLSALGGTTVPVSAPETASYYTHGTHTYTLPSWFNLGVDFLDVIALGPGGGGGGGASNPGSTGSNTTVTVGGTTVTATAGSGGAAGNCLQTYNYGASPGNDTYNGVTYYGGATSAYGYGLVTSGSSPGGGGAGGGTGGIYAYGGAAGTWTTQTLNPTTSTVSVTVGAGGAASPYFLAESGADGAVWLVARQA